MEFVGCNLCGSDRSKPILRGPDVRCRTPGEFTILRCRACGLSYVSPRPEVQEIGKHYPATYTEHTEAHLGNAFASTEADIVRSRFAAPGSVLDVGCASGAFLRAMRRHEWTVAGTDTSEKAFALATSIPGADIRLGLLEADAFPPDSFDAVTLWSVFEHLHDPLGTLRVLRDVIKPDGRLFMVLPNFRSLERMLFRTRWFALELPRHLYHFTPATLDRMLGRGGFQVETMDHASGHDTFRFSLRLLAGRSASTTVNEPHTPEETAQARIGPVAPVIRRVNGAIVSAFTTTADKLAMGSQLLVVARPS